MNSGFKTKSEEIEWRRAKILELSSQGLDQREMAQVLHVSPATITFDLQYLRDKASENVHEYTTKLYPLQFKVTLISIQKCMKEYWNLAQTATDNKEKILALEHYRQTHIDMMAMLQSGGFNLDLIERRHNHHQYQNGKASHIYQGDTYA